MTTTEKVERSTEKTQEFIVPAAVLESILGLGNRRVRDLAAEGHLIRAPGNDAYALVASMKTIVAKKDAEITSLRDDVDPAMRQAKLELTQSQLAISELKRGTMSSALIPRVNIAPAWARVVLALKSQILQIPARAKERIPRLTKTDQALLKALVRDALTQAGAVENRPPRIGVVG
jgi:phage terminase Nu1 subunit (DNA packaging protein)